MLQLALYIVLLGYGAERVSEHFSITLQQILVLGQYPDDHNHVAE
jgi:hypothetical protein